MQRRVAVVVDDSLSARRALAELMRDMGYEVHAARDGIEAVELLDQHTADIVLADLEMPRMNGLELALSSARRRANASWKRWPPRLSGLMPPPWRRFRLPGRRRSKRWPKTAG
jgi:CheY-like chemotaxis protein